MGRGNLLLVLSLVCLSACTPHQAPVVPELLEPVAVVPEPPPACVEKPPKIIEVAVPVPMPCQLKPLPEPVLTPIKSTKPGVRGIAAANSAARQGPSDGQFVNAIQSYRYMPGALYQVYVGLTNATVVLLQPGEQMLGPGYIGGEGERWKFAPITSGSPEGLRSGVAISCAWADIHTNLTITTDKRLYLLELHCTEATYMAQVSWEYGPVGGQMIMGNATPVVLPTAQPAPHEPVSPPEQLNMNYTITQTGGKGTPRWLAGLRVYDNLVQTYIRFPAESVTADAPVLYARTAEGTLELINYKVTPPGQPLTYIVDGVGDQFELRSGEKHPLIVQITRTKGL